MAGLLPEFKYMNVAPALQAYRAGVDDYRGDQKYAQEQEQRNLLKAVGQTAATQGLNAAGVQAMQGGDIATGIKLQDLSLDRQSKLYEFMGRGAAAADTPEKWQAFVGTLSKTFGPDTVRGFEDFRTRDSAIMLAMNAKEQADLKLRQDAQKLQERQVKVAEQTANRREAPTITEIFDPVTGQPQKALVDPASGKTTAIGGIKKDDPKQQLKVIKTETGAEQLVRVNSDNTYTPVTPAGGTPEQSVLAKNIKGGLDNLRKMTEKYDNVSFESSVGPFQGSEPDSLVKGTVINAARGIGEAYNAVMGGKSSPNEVRNDIKSATETLAAAIKPLIRKPGEGAWTDADQARLVAIVGDLSQSSNKEEFKRRLNNVRDSLSSNFGLKIDFDALGGSKKPSSALTIASKAEYDKLESGTVFIGSDGKQYRKP